jgi:tetratricopeptide (TPR) repeat protein
LTFRDGLKSRLFFRCDFGVIGTAIYDLSAMTREGKRIIALGFGLTLISVGLAQPTATKQQQVEQHSQKAHMFLAQQRPDLAIPEFQSIVALDPDNVDAQGNLGVLLFFSGDSAGALPHLRSAVKAQPGLSKIQALLGLAEGRLNDASSSRADLEAAFPHLTDEKFQLEVGKALIDNYTAAGDLEKAAATLSALLASRPTDASLLYVSYRIYSDLAARSMLTLALAAPTSAEMHQVMARELARHGDTDPAIANYREAIKINPQLPGLHTELGDLLYHSSEKNLKSEAEAEFKAALAANPRDEKAQLSLGIIAQKNADLKAAFAADSRALQIDPNDTDACTELAKVLVMMNQQEQAQQMFERAIQIDPTNYVAHFRLATMYRQQGKTDEAKQQVAEYLKYKQMKDSLEKVFRDMRVESGQHPDKDTASATP